MFTGSRPEGRARTHTYMYQHRPVSQGQSSQSMYTSHQKLTISQKKTCSCRHTKTHLVQTSPMTTHSPHFLCGRSNRATSPQIFTIVVLPLVHMIAGAFCLIKCQGFTCSPKHLCGQRSHMMATSTIIHVASVHVQSTAPQYHTQPKKPGNNSLTHTHTGTGAHPQA